MFEVEKVIKGQYCVGCGNCAHIAPSQFVMEEDGFANLIKNQKSERQIPIFELVDKVCPFSGVSSDEDILRKRLYGELSNFNFALGFYEKIHIGWDNNEGDRIASSSGGLASFVAKEALLSGLVDAVIVVSYENGIGYSVVRNMSDLEAARQSKYILKGYHNILEEVASIDGRYMFFGVPCHVKAIRLLCEQQTIFANRIIYTAAVFCGHQKTKAFSEYIAWQLGVPPQKFDSLTYRVKQPGYKSHEYFYRANSIDGKSNQSIVSSMRWLDWGLGLFKLKACDYCDDVAGETADIIFGDAWIKPFTSDYRGTNVVICRNNQLQELLNISREKGLITLLDADESAIFASQGANFRHRKEGLLERINEASNKGNWFPKRRDSLFDKFVRNPARRDLYIQRMLIAQESHKVFEIARSKGDIEYFFSGMSPAVEKYYKLQRTELSYMERIKRYLKYLFRVFLND